MRSRKNRDPLTQNWESQANLSVFLFLLILLVFVFPSLGIGMKHLALYADVGVTIILLAGTGIAWGNRIQFILTSVITGLAIIVKWAA